MKTYKIIGKTNPWIASRDAEFGGKTLITLESGLTLREAQKCLLKFFNMDFEEAYHNWGLVVINHHEAWSRPDGTRGYERDSRYFTIEEENE